MSARSAEGPSTTSVLAALASGKKSQRTLLRQEARWADRTAAFQALPMPARALKPAAASLLNGQQTGVRGPHAVLGKAGLEHLPGHINPVHAVEEAPPRRTIWLRLRSAPLTTQGAGALWAWRWRAISWSSTAERWRRAGPASGPCCGREAEP